MDFRIVVQPDEPDQKEASFLWFIKLCLVITVQCFILTVHFFHVGVNVYRHVVLIIVAMIPSN